MSQTLNVQDTTIRLEPDPQTGGQTVRIQATDLGIHLAHLLGAVLMPDGMYVVTHSREVDHLAMELIDMLIAMRYSHPSFVQLRLAMNEPRR